MAPGEKTLGRESLYDYHDSLRQASVIAPAPGASPYNVVKDDDVTALGASYAPGVSNGAWAAGDFDYNGFVDDDDVTIAGAFYDPSAALLAAPAALGSGGVARGGVVSGREVSGEWSSADREAIDLVDEAVASEIERGDGPGISARGAEKRLAAVD
jgi:hypothetical protein